MFMDGESAKNKKDFVFVTGLSDDGKKASAIAKTSYPSSSRFLEQFLRFLGKRYD
jgi:hypothetical protein